MFDYECDDVLCNFCNGFRDKMSYWEYVKQSVLHSKGEGEWEETYEFLEKL